MSTRIVRFQGLSCFSPETLDRKGLVGWGFVTTGWMCVSVFEYERVSCHELYHFEPNRTRMRAVLCCAVVIIPHLCARARDPPPNE